MAEKPPPPKYRLHLLEKDGVGHYYWGTIEGAPGERPEDMATALRARVKAYQAAHPGWTFDDLIADFESAGYAMYRPGGVVKKIHTEWVTGSRPTGSMDTILLP